VKRSTRLAAIALSIGGFSIFGSTVNTHAATIAPNTKHAIFEADPPTTSPSGGNTGNGGSQTPGTGAGGAPTPAGGGPGGSNGSAPGGAVPGAGGGSTGGSNAGAPSGGGGAGK
jgi:hypothetical protein